MATLYKKKDMQSVKSKVRQPLTEDETTRVNLVVNKFVELFKIKHLG
jgi:hypothetical protein